jgi:flagellar biosynthesis protein FliR
MYEKIEAKMDKRFVYAIGGGALSGVMAFVTVAFGLSAVSTNGVVFGVSFAFGAFLVLLQRKRPESKWIGEYLMTISMLVAMAAACIIF